MRRGDEHIEVQGRYVVAVDDGNAYLAAGVAGMGILWLPQYMAEAHVAGGELVPLFEDGWRFEAMPMYVAFPPNRHVSAKLRAFIDWVVELMALHAPVGAIEGGVMPQLSVKIGLYTTGPRTECRRCHHPSSCRDSS